VPCMDTFTIIPKGPFLLEESARFGFGQRHDEGYDGTMRLAFVVDGWEGTAGVALTQAGGRVDATVSGSGDLDAVERQVARMLSLDYDARGLVRVGESDANVARLLAAAPGLRPPLFHSPYEAAVWAVLSARRAWRSGQTWRRRLSEAIGSTVEVAGRVMPVLPLPERLVRLDALPGLEPVRVERLRGVAEAALEGRLEVDLLRALEPDEARSRLRTINGIGPFYADLILLRAVGTADVLPLAEPRLQAVIGELYGFGGAVTPGQLADVAEAWRPWRTWVCVLARAASGRLDAAA
jgi:DNA-3-methyladenine glycosylase II